MRGKELDLSGWGCLWFFIFILIGLIVSVLAINFGAWILIVIPAFIGFLVLLAVIFDYDPFNLF